MVDSYPFPDIYFMLAQRAAIQDRKAGGKVRLLHLIHSPQLRGAELFAIQLASALKMDGFENAVCSLYSASSNDGLLKRTERLLSIGAQRRGLAAKLGLQPTLSLKLAAILRKVAPDIVVAHGTDTLKYAVIARPFGHRPLTVYRNIGMASFWSVSPWKTWGIKTFLRGVDTVVSVSQATREDFLRVYRFPEQKAVAIPNGVDERLYQEPSMEHHEMRWALGLTEEDAVLISVGSLSSEKNHSQLLSILPRLHARGLRAHLLLVGDGPLRKQLEQEARETQVEPFVHFLGIRTDVPQLLKIANLFLLPSKTEGMPGALIEAGMAGLPSVAYDVGGVKEVIENDITGFLVPPGDLSSFETATASLLEDRGKRLRMGANARLRCMQNFSMDSIAKQYEELFLGLLKERRKLGHGRT